MNNHYKILLYLCIFSVLYSLVFINIYQYPILGDAQTYYAYGVNLYKGNGYSYQESPPFAQSNMREPGYPVFIYGLFKIFGVSQSVIQTSQAVLNGVIAVVTYCLTIILFNNKKRALTAAILTAISPTIAGYAALIASETFATVCLMLLCLSFIMLLKEKHNRKKIGLAILTGLFCGSLVLTKMIYLLYIPLICLVLFIISKDKLFRYLKVLCIGIVFIVMLLPWVSFNNKIYGNSFFLTTRSGIGLALKAERLNYSIKETLIAFIYPFSERLVQIYFPDEYSRVSTNPVEGSAYKTTLDRYGSLLSQGYSEMAADKELRVEALNKIKKNILKYTILSISDFHFMLYFDGLPLSQFTTFFKSGVSGGINLFFKIYSIVIIAFAIKGIFIMMQNKENRFLKIVFLLPVFYTFLMYSAIFGAPRYTFLIIPFIYILASVSISELIKTRVSS